MKTLSKLAGILDTPKKTLAPDVWTKDLKLRPDIREEILSKLYELVPKESVKEAVILGTITGYQWTPTSDIDVNPVIDPPELLTPELNEKRYRTNGWLAGNTKHPVSFLLQKWNGKPMLWQDAKFGAYDILKNTWASYPPPSHILHPKEQFKLELISGRMLLRSFSRLIKKYQTSSQQLENLKRLPESWFKNWSIEKKQNEIDVDTQNLIEFVKNIDDQRKMDYAIGWGAPRVNWNNIVFKLLESSEYSELFEYFKEIHHLTTQK